MPTFADFATAATFRDLVQTVVRSELERQRPSYVYGTVTAIDTTRRRCSVQFPGEAESAEVAMGAVYPAGPGQVVRVAGRRGDRYIDDVLGPGQLMTSGAAGDTVSDVTGTAPITSTGGQTPAIGLADLGVATGHLANSAVTAAKIADGSVTAAEIAASAMGAGLTGGAGTALAIDTAVVARKFSADLGAVVTTTLTHNLGTRDVQVTVRQTASPYAEVRCAVHMPTINTVSIGFTTAPAAGAFRATIVG